MAARKIPGQLTWQQERCYAESQRSPHLGLYTAVDRTQRPFTLRLGHLISWAG
jgi:hypothetical protein